MTTPATRATETAGRRSSESAPTPGLFYERRKIARWAPSEADDIRTGKAADAALLLWAMTTMESLTTRSASPSVHLHTRSVEVRSLPQTLRFWSTLLSCTASRIPLARSPALAPSASIARSLAYSPAGLARLPSRPDAPEWFVCTLRFAQGIFRTDQPLPNDADPHFMRGIHQRRASPERDRTAAAISSAHITAALGPTRR